MYRKQCLSIIVVQRLKAKESKSTGEITEQNARLYFAITHRVEKSDFNF